MSPHTISLAEKKRQLGLSGISAAAVGLAALLPEIAHAQVFTAAEPVGVTADSAVTWDPFSSTATSDYYDGGISAFFYDGNVNLYPTCGFSLDISYQPRYSIGWAGLDHGDSQLPAFVLGAGDLINSHTAFTDHYVSAPYASIPAGDFYFAYQITGGDLSAPAYGWAKLNFDGEATYSLSEWAIEKDAGSIIVGLAPTGGSAVPEPATTATLSGLFFAGFVGYVRWKKRRALRLTAAA